MSLVRRWRVEFRASSRMSAIRHGWLDRQARSCPPKVRLPFGEAMERLLERPRATQAQIRQRIIDELSRENLVLRTEHTLRGLLEHSLTQQPLESTHPL